MSKLPVIFRAERSGPFKGEITAVFPTIAADYAGRLMQCYAHIGQHCAGSLDWYRSTRPATPEESADLLAELVTIYTTRPLESPEIYGESVELETRQRITRAMRRELRDDAREARADVRKDPGGAPWSPSARAQAFA